MHVLTSFLFFSVSAFYAEHYNKRISFNAHIYTKSKFLGLSVCVYNIGQGVVNVIDYDEEYYLTFPNGYGRSILTVPWIELGGTVQITCPKTGISIKDVSYLMFIYIYQLYTGYAAKIRTN